MHMPNLPKHDCLYDNEMVAPSASSVFCSFSASSFGRFSLRTCGHDSTNFLAWMISLCVKGVTPLQQIARWRLRARASAPALLRPTNLGSRFQHSTVGRSRGPSLPAPTASQPASGFDALDTFSPIDLPARPSALRSVEHMILRIPHNPPQAQLRTPPLPALAYDIDQQDSPQPASCSAATP